MHQYLLGMLTCCNRNINASQDTGVAFVRVYIGTVVLKTQVSLHTYCSVWALTFLASLSQFAQFLFTFWDTFAVEYIDFYAIRSQHYSGILVHKVYNIFVSFGMFYKLVCRQVHSN